MFCCQNSVLFRLFAWVNFSCMVLVISLELGSFDHKGDPSLMTPIGGAPGLEPGMLGLGVPAVCASCRCAVVEFLKKSSHLWKYTTKYLKFKKMFRLFGVGWDWNFCHPNVTNRILYNKFL